MFCMCNDECGVQFHVGSDDMSSWNKSTDVILRASVDHHPVLLVSRAQHPDITELCDEMDVHLLHEREEYWVVVANYSVDAKANFSSAERRALSGYVGSSVDVGKLRRGLQAARSKSIWATW